MTDASSTVPHGRSFLASVDLLLRGGFTREEDLRDGHLRVPVRTLILACGLLGAIHGLMMGLFAGTMSGNWAQALASAVKVPLLFLLTLAVTFPSLYVFSALARSKLDLHSTLRLLLVAITVNLAVLASFGPVLAFFSFSTSSYPFIKVLNVAFFGLAGLVGLSFLRQVLKPILGTVPAPEPVPPKADEEADDKAKEEAGGEFERLSERMSTRHYVAPPPRDPALRVFGAWLVIYGVVGAQMGWLLRPFIGTPNMPFQLFRERDSNFLYDVLRTIGELLG